MSAFANWSSNIRCIASIGCLFVFASAIFIIICCFFSGKDLNKISCSSVKNTKSSNHDLSFGGDLGGDIDGVFGDGGGDIDGDFADEDLGGDIDGVLAEEDHFGLMSSNETGLLFIDGCFFSFCSFSIILSYSAIFLFESANLFFA